MPELLAARAAGFMLLGIRLGLGARVELPPAGSRGGLRAARSIGSPALLLPALATDRHMLLPASLQLMYKEK